MKRLLLAIEIALFKSIDVFVSLFYFDKIEKLMEIALPLKLHVINITQLLFDSFERSSEVVFLSFICFISEIPSHSSS